MTSNDQPRKSVADAQKSIAEIYEDKTVARTYLDKRQQFSSQRILHGAQVVAVNTVILRYRPKLVLELAPGPARLSAELRGLEHGVMIENSKEMLAIAQTRLERAGCANKWQMINGDAFQMGALVPAGAFDFAYSFRFIRHFRDSDRERLYGGLYNCLSPSGLLMIDVVNAPVRARLDRRRAVPASEELRIHDACYSKRTFAEEMAKSGFEVLSLTPVLKHFWIQSFLSYKLDDIIPGMIERTVRAIERIPTWDPLEWISLCRKV